MKKVKITKEQYTKLVKAGIINESDNVVDKGFKKAFAGKDVRNLNYIPEEKIELGSKFNLKKPLPGIKNSIKEEVHKLLEYIYGLNEEFSPFWESNDLSYEDICEILENKGYLIKKEGVYKVSKKMGDVNSVKEGIEQTLSEALKPIEEDYPAGAEFDSRAPYNREDSKTVRGTSPSKNYVEIKYMNPEIAIFKDNSSGDLYVFYYANLDKDVLEPYADRYGFTDSQGDMEYYDDFDITDETIENYVNDNFQSIKKGIGVNDFESNDNMLVKIDGELKDDLLHLHDKDSRLVMVLQPIAESTYATSSGAYTALFSPTDEKPEEYDDKKLPPVVTEMDSADAGNFGYDNPGLVGVSRNGDYSKNPKKTKAQKNTQWAGGAFVKMDNCTKLNNNKTAQNGGCSTGAADNVVKLQKTKGNINAPSLSENKKYSIYKLDRIVKKNNI